MLEPMYAELEETPPAHGVLIVRISVLASGKVAAVEAVADTLVPDPQALTDLVSRLFFDVFSSSLDCVLSFLIVRL